MKPTHISMLSSLSGVVAQGGYKGFNLRNTVNGDGATKARSDWDSSFKTLKALPGGYNAARVYSTTDMVDGALHYYLPDILPSAKQHDMLVLLSLYLGNQTVGPNQFDTEFQALKDGIGNFSADQVIGISVGNEDLYGANGMPYVDAAKLATQIKTVKQWVQANVKGCIPVGHTDTWGALIQPDNKPVLEASDFVLANIFPFWEQKVTIDMAKAAFDDALNQTQLAALASDNLDVWIGETGWGSTENPTNPLAVGSIPNLQRYWNEIACGGLWDTHNAFWYVNADNGIWNLPPYAGGGPSFGVLYPNGTHMIDLTCAGVKRPAPPSASSTSPSKRHWLQWWRRQAAASSSPSTVSISRQSCPVKKTMGPTAISTALSKTSEEATSMVGSNTTQPMVTSLSPSSAIASSTRAFSLTSPSPVASITSVSESSSTVSTSQTQSPGFSTTAPAYSIASTDGVPGRPSPLSMSTSQCNSTGTVVLSTTWITQTVFVTETDIISTVFVGPATPTAEVASSTIAANNASSANKPYGWTNATGYSSVSVASPDHSGYGYGPPQLKTETVYPIMYTERTSTPSPSVQTTTVQATVTALTITVTSTIEMLGNGTNATPAASSDPAMQVSSSSSTTASSTVTDTSITTSSSTPAAISSRVPGLSTTDAAAALSVSSMSVASLWSFTSDASATTDATIGKGLAGAVAPAATSAPSTQTGNQGWDPRRVAMPCGDGIPCNFPDSSAFYASHTPMPRSLGWPKAVEGLV